MYGSVLRLGVWKFFYFRSGVGESRVECVFRFSNVLLLAFFAGHEIYYPFGFAVHVCSDGVLLACGGALEFLAFRDELVHDATFGCALEEARGSSGGGSG